MDGTGATTVGSLRSTCDARHTHSWFSDHTHTNAQRSVRRAAFRMGAGASCGCAHMDAHVDARQHVPLMREEREREVVWLCLRTVLASVAARIRAVHELLRARQAVALTRVCTVVRFA